ncbi:hypothetical protein ACF0H5_014319 [Mactra antiquata]
MKAVLAFIALSVFCLKTTLALKCYECQLTSNCADPFSPSDNLISKDDCKTCMKSKAEHGGKTVVARGCSDGSEANVVKANECKDIDVDGQKAHICVCNTDRCNHGNSIEMNLTKTVILGMSVWILKYFYM